MSYLGKFRGKVVNNVDPLMVGRIIPMVPAISEMPLTWATPCVPYAGHNVGFFAMPPIGADVWIEFEGGDPGKPIWSGCFWGEDDVPATPALPTTKVFKTETVTLTINDLLTEVTLEVITPAGIQKVVMNPSGITLSSNAASISIAQEAIDLSNTPAKVSVAPQAVTIQHTTAKASIAAENLALQNGAASLEISPASMALKNGAASIELSPVTVSLNQGALEVM